MVVVLALLLPAGVGAAGAIKPDSSCATESSYKSQQGIAPAELTVFNNSDETVKVWWLNYDGKRTFYRDLAPHKSYIQPTWLSHPWVISSVGGACYRFLVMTSIRQTVTVSPEIPDPEATTVSESPTPSPGSPVPAASSRSTAGASAEPVVVTPGGSSSDFAPLLVMGVLASMVAVLIAGLAATGRLPAFLRGGRPPRP